jgi:TM2 domain-containing membrane protein YozV
MQETNKTRAMNADDVASRPHPPLPGSGPSPDQAQADKTQAIPVGQIAPGNADSVTQVNADTLLADAERRRKIEMDLARMGMSPVEIRRLLDADANSADPLRQTQAVAQVPPSPPVSNRPAPPAGNRPTSDSLAGFAAQLLATQAAKQVKAVVEADLSLPEFRESSAQEVRQAEQILRDAALLRRREKYAEAEKKCREALQLVPKDAAALELLGDLLQGVARINEALAAYKRALEADPKRSSAERKYGELLMRQQHWDTADPEAVPRKPGFALLLSLLLPGLGQFHNGEFGKGLFFLLADLGWIWLLRYSPWGVDSRHGVDMGLVTCIVITLVVYAVSAYDAVTVARKGGSSRGGRSGWGV